MTTQKINLIVKEIKSILGENANVEHIKVAKNNGVILNGITIRTNNNPITPTIYLENYNESLTSREIAKLIIEDNANATSDDMVKSINVNSLANFTDFAKSHIVYRLINKKANEELLKTVPHRIFLDLAIIYAIQITEEASMKVTNEIMKSWNINEEVLYNLAMENTPNIFPPSVDSLFELMCEMMEIAPEEAMMMGMANDLQIVVSNEAKTNGAATILYPNVIENLHARYGTLAILPSSIHEVIVVPMNDNIDPETLTQMVKEVNQQCVSTEEVLSDHAYIYDGEWK